MKENANGINEQQSMTESANENKEQQSMTDFTNENNAPRPVSPEEVYAYKFLIISEAQKLKYRKDYHSAEDLVQELAIKCWLSPTVRYNPAKGSLASFLKKIAKNMIYDQWRKERKLKIEYTLDDEKRHTSYLKTSDDSDDFDKPLIAPDDSYEKKYQQQERVLDRAIAELYRQYPSKKSIDAFVMFARHGKPAREVARLLGVDEGFVNTAVCRVKKRLKTIARCMNEEDEWLTSAD